MALATRLRAAPFADRMRDEPREWVRGEFVISTDRARLDLDAVHQYISTSYWAAGMPRAVLERAVENSLIFGIYDGSRQVGFAPVFQARTSTLPSSRPGPSTTS